MCCERIRLPSSQTVPHGQKNKNTSLHEYTSTNYDPLREPSKHINTFLKCFTDEVMFCIQIFIYVCEGNAKFETHRIGDKEKIFDARHRSGHASEIVDHLLGCLGFTSTRFSTTRTQSDFWGKDLLRGTTPNVWRTNSRWDVGLFCFKWRQTKYMKR